jgi:hypothetical protein
MLQDQLAVLMRRRVHVYRVHATNQAMQAGEALIELEREKQKTLINATGF